ncbi:shikimate kinase [Mollicutes bacterium LVI A0039]|nr:shikimate kinase [Mollicutes bacterium LVI A0039]
MSNWGLIGNNINYSLSPAIHNYLIAKHNLDAEYQIHNTAEFNRQELAQFTCGNITIPHKHAAYKLAKTSNFSDQSINSFKLVDGNYQFLSTDQYGIIDSIEKLKIKYIETRLHVIYGDGATSAMLQNVLIDKFAVPRDKIYVISRKHIDLRSTPKTIDKNYFEQKLLNNYVLYNTTPLGGAQYASQSPFTEDKVRKALAVFDVTYTPNFNQLAKYSLNHRVRYINGLNMLIVQALYAFKFWTGIKVLNEYSHVKRHVLFQSSSKLIVCAMPFAGKTTLYKRYKRVGCDLDLEVASYTKMPNNQLIEEQGLDAFRAIEVEVLAQQLRDDAVKVIFLGGGTLTNPAAVNLLSDQLVVYMTVSLKTLKSRFTKSRANILSEKQLEKLYYERNSHYSNIAQMQIGVRNIERTINEYLDY